MGERIKGGETDLRGREIVLSSFRVRGPAGTFLSRRHVHLISDHIEPRGHGCGWRSAPPAGRETAQSSPAYIKHTPGVVRPARPRTRILFSGSQRPARLLTLNSSAGAVPAHERHRRATGEADRPQRVAKAQTQPTAVVSNARPATTVQTRVCSLVRRRREDRPGAVFRESLA